MKDETFQIQIASSVLAVEQQLKRKALPPVVNVLLTGGPDGTDPRFQLSSGGLHRTLSTSAAIIPHRQHSGIQMESRRSPSGQS